MRVTIDIPEQEYEIGTEVILAAGHGYSLANIGFAYRGRIITASIDIHYDATSGITRTGDSFFADSGWRYEIEVANAARRSDIYVRGKNQFRTVAELRELVATNGLSAVGQLVGLAGADPLVQARLTTLAKLLL